MKTTFKSLFIGAVSLVGFSQANAASLNTDLSGNITGFNDIEIAGSLYNATFSDTFTGTFYKKDFAWAASEALAKEFNKGGAFDGTNIDLRHETKVVGFEKGTFEWSFNKFFTAYDERTDLTGTYLMGKALFNEIAISSVPDALALSSAYADIAGMYDNMPLEKSHTTFLTWEKASVSAVPVPAAAFLFAPALLGFMGLRRKATKKA